MVYKHLHTRVTFTHRSPCGWVNLWYHLASKLPTQGFFRQLPGQSKPLSLVGTKWLDRKKFSGYEPVGQEKFSRYKQVGHLIGQPRGEPGLPSLIWQPVFSGYKLVGRQNLATQKFSGYKLVGHEKCLKRVNKHIFFLNKSVGKQ